MRFVVSLGAVVMMLTAQMAASAKPPSGSGQQKGNSGQSTPTQGSTQQSNSLTQQLSKTTVAKQGNLKPYPGKWEWRWYAGRGWYAPDGRYLVARPVFDPIRIVNPSQNGVTLSYILNGLSFSIPPGYSQKLEDDRRWVIEFNRGAGFGVGRYLLEPGRYQFASTDHGWELFRSAFSALPPVAGALPPNPLPGQGGQSPVLSQGANALPGQSDPTLAPPQPAGPTPDEGGQPPSSSKPKSPGSTNPQPASPGSTTPGPSGQGDAAPQDSKPPGSGPF